MDQIRVGITLAKAARVFTRHAPILMLVSAMTHLTGPLRDLLGLTDDPSLLMRAPGAVIASGAIAEVDFLLTPIAISITCHVAWLAMDGRNATLRETMAFGRRRYFPVLGVTLAAGLSIGAGFALLIIPGFIIAAAVAVAVPVCVLEHLGPIKSIDRSYFLTKGHRWRIIRCFSVPIMAGLVLFLAERALTRDAVAGLRTIMDLVVVSTLTAFSIVLAVVLYCDLRVLREAEHSPAGIAASPSAAQ